MYWWKIISWKGTWWKRNNSVCEDEAEKAIKEINGNVEFRKDVVWLERKQLGGE